MNKELRPSVFKRFLALVVDFIVLGIFGYLLGIFLEDFFASLGNYGTLVGSAISILYFSIMQSHIGKGQSVGKMVVNIRVTDVQGNYLTFKNSLLRAFILIFPVMNIELLTSSGGTLIIMSIIMMVTFVTIYFILVNKSRRSLHDILVSSIVTYKYVTAFEIDEQNDRSKKKLIPVYAMAVLFIGIFGYQSFAENTLGQLLVVKEIIEEQPGVIGVNKVQSGTTTQYNSGESSSYTSISIVVRIDSKQEAVNLESHYFNEFYEIIQQELADAKQVDFVTITLYYGYNIGISKKTTAVTNTIEVSKSQV